MTEPADILDRAAALLDEMRDHPGRVLIERQAWQIVMRLADESLADDEFGREIRHVIEAYRTVRDQPEPLSLPDSERHIQ